MADPILINERRHQALDRLMAGCARLAETAGVAPPVAPNHLTKDTQFHALQDIECVANFIEAANESLAEKAATIAKSLEEPKRRDKVRA